MYVTLSHDSHHTSIINLIRKINVIMRYGVQLIFFLCHLYFNQEILEKIYFIFMGKLHYMNFHLTF